MDITVQRSAIQDELVLVQGIVESHTTIPILSHILLSASGSALNISATDLQLSLKTQCKAQIKKEGAVTLNARKFFDIIKSLPGDEVNLKKGENNWVTITSGAANFKMVGLAESEFPAIPEFDGVPMVSIPLAELREMLQRVVFAVPVQENRFSVSGAQWELRKKALVMVATDGHRLSVLEKEITKVNLDREQNLLVSRKTMEEILHLKGSEMILDLGVDGNHLFIQAGERVIASRLLEGNFPDYKAILSQKGEQEVILDRSRLVESLRRVSLISTERIRGVEFLFKNGELSLFSSNPELGEARESMPATYEGEEIKIKFNSEYVLDFLGAVKTDEVRVHLQDGTRQGNFGLKDDPYQSQYIVMPMSL